MLPSYRFYGNSQTYSLLLIAATVITPFTICYIVVSNNIMITFVEVSLFFFAYYMAYLWDTYSYWKKRGIFGPTPWPIVGNYGPILFLRKQEHQLINELYEKYPKEKYVGIFIGTKPALILRDLGITKLISTTEFSKFSDRPTSPALARYGKNLLLAPGNEKWKQNRKILSGLSKPNEMAKVTDAIEYTTKYFLNYVDTRLEKSTKLNIFHLQEEYFFAVACNAVLGKGVNSGFDKETLLRRRIRLFENGFTWEFRNCFELMFPWIIKTFKTPIQTVTHLIFNSLIKLSTSVIKDRQNKENREFTTFSDLIVDLQDQQNCIREGTLDDDTIAFHLILMKITITMITSRTASYLMFVMAQYPDIQNKCYDEINKVLQKYDDKLCFKSISEMKYFDMVVQEVMRKYGNSFTESRICNTNYCFPGSKLEITPGTQIFIPMESYRKDPKLFPDPDEIIPERFAPENLNKLPLRTNLSFGYGRRDCMGKPIAMFILKMCTAAFLHRFKVQADGNIDNLRNDPRFRFRKPAKDQQLLHIINRKNKKNCQ